MRRILLVTTVATILTGSLCALLKPSHDGPLPRDFRHPVIAAELVTSAAEIVQVYGTSAQNGACEAEPADAQPPDCASIRMLRWNTWADFLFIACYATMFFFLGRSTSGWLGIAITILAPLAALADVVENIGILRATAEPATDFLAWTIRTPSLIKWAALGLIWTALFRRFVVRGVWRAAVVWRVAALAVGTLYALSGLICLFALIDGNAVIETGTALLVPALLGQFLIFWRNPPFLVPLDPPR
jgi:hypothetical protein